MALLPPSFGRCPATPAFLECPHRVLSRIIRDRRAHGAG
jgi:hypothetical protein